MKKAYIFPGQGSQFPGMGKELYDAEPAARSLFEQANEIMGFRITDLMFGGTESDLVKTNVTQPAIFIHSVAAVQAQGDGFRPDMVAGHSLGEFSALVANGSLEFGDGLRLVTARANAMQHACEVNAGTMAAILGLEDARVEEVCEEIDDTVVPANYNCPGQVVISGTVSGIETACERLTAAGARRAIRLTVGGAFHSPLMEPARERLAGAIDKTTFNRPHCPVYQNVNANPSSDPQVIKQNLVAQLTSPVRWTQSVEHMVADGASAFIEAGPGKVLQGLVRKINRQAEVAGV
jgi:[acyl-carrier-protein] S-malonyltransferase